MYILVLECYGGSIKCRFHCVHCPRIGWTKLIQKLGAPFIILF